MISRFIELVVFHLQASQNPEWLLDIGSCAPPDKPGEMVANWDGYYEYISKQSPITVT
jgi:hypothetical protein